MVLKKQFSRVVKLWRTIVTQILFLTAFSHVRVLLLLNVRVMLLLLEGSITYVEVTTICDVTSVRI